MPDAKLPPLTVIAHAPDLHQLVQRLAQEPLIAVDTESNSLYAYRERVCLIQLSTREADYIVDPLALSDLAPLGTLFAAPHIEKVLHAAENDVMVLRRDFDFRFANIFDTAAAARILGRKTLGLATMLEEFFGVKLDKRHQRANWMIRPLPPEQLDYARMDTRYLPALRDILHAQLTQRGCLAEAQETFELLTQAQQTQAQFDPNGFWYISHARDFSLRQMAILRELYLLRDQLAQQYDLPPFKVLTDETLAQLAQRVPQTLAELRAVSGVAEWLIAQSGTALLAAVATGQRAELPMRPEQAQRDAAVLARYNALREWRKNRAAARGVESDVIVPREALWAMAENPPRSLEDLVNVPSLGAWRRAQYGAEILQVLASVPEQSESA
ncbi:MAG: HRDC domain-containing protein [Anaerolineae bacterium]|nr:HRDC domain-containing protein [Anaerolineae bacterium]MDW8300691.1 HRDC domain-containing protein [Anaerolineae bacterium]